MSAARTKARAVLREMAKTFENPAKWTTKVYARTRSDEVTTPVASNAEKWCAIGFINRECHDDLGVNNLVRDLLRKKLHEMFGSAWSGITTVNDGPNGRIHIINAARAAAGDSE